MSIQAQKSTIISNYFVKQKKGGLLNFFCPLFPTFFWEGLSSKWNVGCVLGKQRNEWVLVSKVIHFNLGNGATVHYSFACHTTAAGYYSLILLWLDSSPFHKVSMVVEFKDFKLMENAWEKS